MRIQLRVTRIAMRASIAGIFGGAAAFGSIACASAPNGMQRVASSSQYRTHDARPSLATLTASDFDGVPDAANALDAVRQLRPLFLRPRPSSATFRGQPSTIAVYINGMYAGGTEMLQSVPSNTIETMKYLQRSEALTFASTMTPGDGFIMITLKGMDPRRR